MALRSLRYEPDVILTKKCRCVQEINDNIILLVEDMHDTMKYYSGVGLAAPQVGMLKRIITIDDEDDKFDMINPEIIAAEGIQTGEEACLSVPRIMGTVERPDKITVRYTNLSGDTQTISADGRLAVIIAHEIDHLDGILYRNRALPGSIRENKNEDGEVTKKRRKPKQ